MWEKPLLNRFPDDEHPARKVDIFIGDVAAIAERVSIRREKTLVASDNSQLGRRLESVVNSLAVEIESLQANLARAILHQLTVAQPLPVSDIPPILELLCYIPACISVRREFCELENVRPEKADS